MRYRLVLLAVIFLLMGGRVEANTFDMSLNDNCVQLGYRYPLAEDELGRSVLNSRFLYNDREETILASVGLDFAGLPGNVPGLDLAVGAQVHGGRTDNSRDLLGIGIGSRVEYLPPFLGGVSGAARISYVPGILAFLEAERMLETAIRLGYAVTPRARVHVEYQVVRTDVEDGGNWTIDEGVRLGFEAKF